MEQRSGRQDAAGGRRLGGGNRYPAWCSISYDLSRPDWGFDFIRYIRRRAERDRWTSLSPTISATDISQAGTLTGITDAKSGIGLDLQLYGRLTLKRDWEPTEHDSLSGFLSANAYYKVAQALTATVTLNPDFF